LEVGANDVEGYCVPTGNNETLIFEFPYQLTIIDKLNWVDMLHF